VSAAGCVVWITGLPSSGKSTLAAAVSARLAVERRPCAVLDGDELRAALVPHPGYDPAARDAFYATLAGIAALLARQGLVVLVPATANRRAYRARAREQCARFVEVYVDVAADECARRDAKGLYAQARAGAAPDLPGSGASYEPPDAPEIVASGGRDGGAIERIVAATR
jgi:adenylylsulfate kinase